MQTVPSCVKECWELLSSEPFFILLSNMTGLHLHFLAQCNDDDESEDEKTEKENGDEGNTHAEGCSSTTEMETSAEKKPKGAHTVHLCRFWKGQL